MRAEANPPSVAEMVRLMRRRPASKALLEMHDAELVDLAQHSTASETRMLASVLATMTAGQRKLLAWKAR